MIIETPDKPSIEQYFEGEDPEAAERRANHLREKPKQNDVRIKFYSQLKNEC